MQVMGKGHFRHREWQRLIRKVRKHRTSGEMQEGWHRENIGSSTLCRESSSSQRPSMLWAVCPYMTAKKKKKKKVQQDFKQDICFKSCGKDDWWY